MGTRFCIKLTCIDEESCRFHGHEPSFYPRYYVEIEWDGTRVPRWTEAPSQATSLPEQEASDRLFWLRLDYENRGEKLVVADHDQEVQFKNRYEA